jgi:hypothetical protein
MDPSRFQKVLESLRSAAREDALERLGSQRGPSRVVLFCSLRYETQQCKTFILAGKL